MYSGRSNYRWVQEARPGARRRTVAQSPSFSLAAFESFCSYAVTLSILRKNPTRLFVVVHLHLVLFHGTAIDDDLTEMCLKRICRRWLKSKSACCGGYKKRYVYCSSLEGHEKERRCACNGGANVWLSQWMSTGPTTTWFCSYLGFRLQHPFNSFV